MRDVPSAVAVPLTFVLILDIDMSDNLKEEVRPPEPGGDKAGEKTPLIKRSEKNGSCLLINPTFFAKVPSY